MPRYMADFSGDWPCCSRLVTPDAVAWLYTSFADGSAAFGHDDISPWNR